jgi:NADPH-dependent ferric siderophore reductase
LGSDRFDRKKKRFGRRAGEKQKQTNRTVTVRQYRPDTGQSLCEVYLRYCVCLGLGKERKVKVE